MGTLRRNLFHSIMPSRMLQENFLTITSPPIPLRVLLIRTIVCILNYHKLFLFSITRQFRIKKLVSTFCNDLDIKLVFTLFKIRNSGYGPRILSLQVYDHKSFTRFHIQAVVPIDTLLLTSVKISTLTNITTYLST